MEPAESPQTASFRRGTLAAALAYLTWWVVVRAVLPNAYNPLGSRLAVVSTFVAIYLTTYASAWARQHIDSLFYAGLWLATAHYFYLFHNNALDVNWVVGFYIILVAACACIVAAKAMWLYSIFVMALCCAFVTLHTALLQTVFLPGALTLIFFANFSLRLRLRLARALAENERTRILYEASQKAIQLREEYLAIISHELKTPLTSIRLRTQMIKRSLDVATGGLEPEKMRRFVEQTDVQTLRLTLLVEEILAVSKVSSGKLQMQKEWVNVSQLMKEAVASLADMPEYRHVTVRLHIQPNVQAWADKFRLEQVIINVFSNALKYGRGNPVDVEVLSASTSVRLSVRDHGMGISNQDRERIFEKFERAVSSREISGLGLGLFICKQIVDAHQGSIELESSPGLGACFTVDLPQTMSRPQP